MISNSKLAFFLQKLPPNAFNPVFDVEKDVFTTTDNIPLTTKQVKQFIIDQRKAVKVDQDFRVHVAQQVTEKLMNNSKSPFMDLQKLSIEKRLSTSAGLVALAELKRKLTRKGNKSAADSLVEFADAFNKKPTSNKVALLFSNEDIKKLVIQRNTANCKFCFENKNVTQISETLLRNDPFRIVSIFIDRNTDVCFDILQVYPIIKETRDLNIEHSIHMQCPNPMTSSIDILPVFTLAHMEFIHEWYVGYMTLQETLAKSPLDSEDMASVLELGKKMYDHDIIQVNETLQKVIAEASPSMLENIKAQGWSAFASVADPSMRIMRNVFGDPSKMLAMLSFMSTIRTALCCVVVISMLGLNKAIHPLLLNLVFGQYFVAILNPIVSVLIAMGTPKVFKWVDSRISMVKNFLTSILTMLDASGLSEVPILGYVIVAIVSLLRGIIKIFKIISTKFNENTASNQVVLIIKFFTTYMLAPIGIYGIALAYLTSGLRTLIGEEATLIFQLIGIGANNTRISNAPILSTGMHILSNIFPSSMQLMSGVDNHWWDLPLVIKNIPNQLIPKLFACHERQGVSKAACMIMQRMILAAANSMFFAQTLGALLYDVAEIYVYVQSGGTSGAAETSKSVSCLSWAKNKVALNFRSTKLQIQSKIEEREELYRKDYLIIIEERDTAHNKYLCKYNEDYDLYVQGLTTSDEFEKIHLRLQEAYIEQDKVIQMKIKKITSEHNAPKNLLDYLNQTGLPIDEPLAISQFATKAQEETKQKIQENKEVRMAKKDANLQHMMTKNKATQNKPASDQHTTTQEQNDELDSNLQIISLQQRQKRDSLELENIDRNRQYTEKYKVLSENINNLMLAPYKAENRQLIKAAEDERTKSFEIHKSTNTYYEKLDAIEKTNEQYGLTYNPTKFHMQ